MNLRAGWAVAITALLIGCTTLPPGSDFPRSASVAFATPESTDLGRKVAGAAREHAGLSGFRLLSAGVDGFLARAQMANAAQRSLDLQYFILRTDATGRLLVDAALRAADRGVRVRILVDDGEPSPGDEQIALLSAHPKVEVRIFNPFVYRGTAAFIRALEFTLNSPRLDYRMHNKLFIADNAVALIGGRNIGDQYFQVEPDSQFADDDVFAAGPIVRELSATFDEYWNSALAIPVEGLSGSKPSAAQLAAFRRELTEHKEVVKAEGTDYALRISSGEPLAGMLSGRLALVWAHAQVVCDSPDKKGVDEGWMVGRLMFRPVALAVGAVQSELLMITPYLIPGPEGMQLLKDLRQRKVRVRVLTNSLESSTVLPAQAGYMHYRKQLLEDGVELHEVRSLLGSARGSGQSAAISSYGNYSLHAKLFVLDRKRLFIGSMNFDQRSMHLNTEVGLIIDSPALAQEMVKRFEAMTEPLNAYKVSLRPADSRGGSSLVWQTQEGKDVVEYVTEPARNDWQRIKVQLLTLLPLDKEL